MNPFRLLVAACALAAAPAFAQGMLIPTDTSMGPLGVKYQRVSADIQDGAAVTKVEQVFVNNGPQQLEAHYVFPLPKGAALQEFYLWINGKKTKGEILEKQKATDIYEGIVRRLKDPGLLEYVDSDVFRARVFPVPARGEQRIELTFSQVLDFQSGIYHYHYPLGAGSRGAPSLRVQQDFTFAANLKSKVPIRSVYSPTHTLGISRKGENEAIAGMEAGQGFDISKDLDLYYTTSEKAIGLSVLSYRASQEEPGYFLALVSPRTEVPKDEVIAKRVSFVIDTSGSMMGDRIKLARESLKYCVQRLNPKDEFNVIRFSTDVEALFDKPMPANGDYVKKALSFVDGMEAIGGTAIDEALTRGLKDAEGKGDKPHMIIFITDGHPTVGSTEEDVIAGNAKKLNKTGSRVFTFGVGDDLNARLLDRIANDGQGTSDFVRDGKEFEIKISAFMDKVANPVLSEVALDLSAFSAFDVYPKRLPDLFKGQQLVVMGRYRTPGEAKAVLSGSFNGGKKTFEYGAAMSKESKGADFIPRLWAIRKVGYLLEEIRLHGERPELKDEVTMLGKKFGIVTPYTSYLVVEDVPVPVAQNQGWRRGDGNMPPPPPAATPAPWQPMAREEADRFAPRKKEAPRAAAAPEPMAEAKPMEKRKYDKNDEAPMDSSDLASAFSSSAGAPAGGNKGGGSGALGYSSGNEGIAVSKATRALKDSERGPGASDPVRVAAGRTYIFRAGGWIDSEALSGTPKQLKVKYLSEAYFALLKAKPELKAGLALGDRVVVVVGNGKSIVIAPNEGEEKADKVDAFLR